ncbi:MAG: hypothetical protein KJ747_08790 [Actinobacteria bacterium]|nr:hypothetical protein [Actinomycetota bacterium]MCG2808663.1 hypothetical protein [Coriobacteriia bacterium]
MQASSKRIEEANGILGSKRVGVCSRARMLDALGPEPIRGPPGIFWVEITVRHGGQT